MAGGGDPGVLRVLLLCACTCACVCGALCRLLLLLLLLLYCGSLSITFVNVHSSALT